MKAGQRPMPTQLKLLRGNPGKQRLPNNEPQPEQDIDVPDPPPFITGYAADEWWTVATQLHRLGFCLALVLSRSLLRLRPCASLRCPDSSGHSSALIRNAPHGSKRFAVALSPTVTHS
jgi:hypothetical protein